MDIYMVGIYKKGSEIKGFRMLSFDETNKKIEDVEYSKVYEILRSKIMNIENLRLENGEIKGYNGKIDRYGIVNKSQSLVILREVQDKNQKFLGYMCSDTMGNMKFLTEQQVIGYANSVAIANGKVITEANGTSRISAIEGSYKVYIKTEQQSNKDNIQEIDIDDETKMIISKLKVYPEYQKSFAKKVEDTILKTKKCTDKQKICLKKILAELEKKDKGNNITNTPAVNNEPTKENVQNKTKTENRPITNNIKEEEINSKPDEKVIEADELSSMLIFENMNGQIYIKGVKKEYKDVVKDIVVPDILEHNGKKVPVNGISVKAFSNLNNVRSIKTGKNIKDIGQYAFASCIHLRDVDLSESQHQHIAMGTFSKCTALMNIKVGNKVQRIHESAFEECKALMSISLPDSTDTIARTAFFRCKSLRNVTSKVRIINDSAFRDCVKLTSFDFSNVNTIGAQAFRGTAFEKIILPGNITVIGRKAFSDCLELEEIKIEEGVEVLGEYCFAKSKSRTPDELNAGRKYVPISSLITSKSIKEIGADAFRNAEMVYVYTGSVSESQCIGFNIPYTRLDESNKDNATKVRIKSEIIDTNPIEVLFTFIRDNTEGASNPAIELKTNKLVDIAFNKNNFEFFGIEETSMQVEPHAKFKGLVNYLQDISDLFTEPLSNGILRLQQTYSVSSHVIYNDGCNRAYKVLYSLVDTLEEGGFIMIIMNNHLRFIAELTTATDVNMNEYNATDENIPIAKFIHAGDKLGNVSTISGRSAILETAEGKINVGKAFFERLSNHCIEIIPQRKDSIWYIPAQGVALKLHDKREWERDNYSKDKKRIARNSEDCLNVIQILNYDELLKEADKLKKHSIDSPKFFKSLSSMSDKEVKSRIEFLGSVEEEKEAQLFQVSKQFVKDIISRGKTLETADPSDLTLKLFEELAVSYWMITKDEKWLSYTGTKSLNKMNEYNIENCKLIEYKSNQVVKFSNPYMNGQKGAYVFTLVHGRNIRGVYASRHSMKEIIKKLVDITKMKSTTVPKTLMTDAYNIDICEHDLFYNFYDVLYSKDGWRYKDFCYGYSRTLWNVNAAFHIAMYKPTGIFYLTMESYIGTEDNPGVKTIPVLPIGNMDRALMIATTTNSKNKDSKLLEELITLSAMVLTKASGKEMPDFKFKNIVDIQAYFKARELAIAGVKDIKQYKQLVNDRVVYMLGTIHKGKLQREHEYRDIDYDLSVEDIEEYNGIEDEYSDVDMSDISLDDVEVDEDAGEGEYDEGYDEYEVDMDEDEVGEDIEITDEMILEVQKELKKAGHNLSKEQIRIMMLQQQNK